MNQPPWPQGPSTFQRDMNRSYQVPRNDYYPQAQALRPMISPHSRRPSNMTFHGASNYYPNDEELGGPNYRINHGGGFTGSMDDNFILHRHPQATPYGRQQHYPFQQPYLTPQAMRPQAFIARGQPLHSYQQIPPQYQQQYVPQQQQQQQVSPLEVNKNFESFDERAEVNPNRSLLYNAGSHPANQSNLNRTVSEQYSEIIAKRNAQRSVNIENSDTHQQSFRAITETMNNSILGQCHSADIQGSNGSQTSPPSSPKGSKNTNKKIDKKCAKKKDKKKKSKKREDDDESIKSSERHNTDRESKSLEQLTRQAGVECELISMEILAKWSSERKSAHINLLEGKLMSLKYKLSSIVQDQSQLEDQKRKIEELELENKCLRNVPVDTPTKGIQDQMKSVSIKPKSVKEELKSYQNKVQELEGQVNFLLSQKDIGTDLATARSNLQQEKLNLEIENDGLRIQGELDQSNISLLETCFAKLLAESCRLRKQKEEKEETLQDLKQKLDAQKKEMRTFKPSTNGLKT